MGVIGGGNVAIDAARTALRLGAKEVQIFYRRLREDMPAAGWEIEEAEKEGVQIHYLVAPAQMWGGNGGVKRLQCRRMTLSDFDASGRKRPLAIAGSEFEVEVDTVIAAVGQAPDTECFRSNGFKFDSSGAFLVDPETLADRVAGQSSPAGTTCADRLPPWKRSPTGRKRPWPSTSSWAGTESCPMPTGIS